MKKPANATGFVTLANWRDNPSEVIERYFAPTGPLAEIIGDPYRRSDVQVAYAIAIANQCVKGITHPGRVALLEAATGIGKSHAYLGVGLINAVLTDSRMLVSTFTNDLKTQVAKQDGAAALLAVEKFTGIRPTIAMRLANAEFASPFRTQLLADRMERQGGSQGAITALRALALWTRRELKYAQENSGDPGIISELRGTRQRWGAENAEIAAHLPQNIEDLWTIDSGSGPQERFIFNMHADYAKNATCVVCSHASTIYDLKLYGAMMGANFRPYGLAVIDEGDRMTNAARSVLASHVTFLGLERALRIALEALSAAGDKIDDQSRIAIAETALSHEQTFAALIETSEILSLANKRRKSVGTRTPVIGDPVAEKWLETCRKAAEAAIDISISLGSLSHNAECAEAASTLMRRGDQMLEFYQAANLPKKDRGRTYLEFSPVNDEPSVVIDAKFGARMMQRLWRDPNGKPTKNTTDRVAHTPKPEKKELHRLADATIVTSATLAEPGAKGFQRFKKIEWELGLDLTPDALDREACLSFSPKAFGKMNFVIAHPDSPIPVPLADEGEQNFDAASGHPALVAKMILAASLRPKNGRANIVVHTTSFAYTAAIFRALPQNMNIPVLARTRSTTTHQARDWLRANPNGVLISPGIWEGFNLPGLIDHDIIAQLPYSPPEDSTGAVFVVKRGGDFFASSEVVEAKCKLLQAFGRGIRQFTDDVTVWIADARFGIPGALLDDGPFVAPRYPKGAVFHSCVPERFQSTFDRAEIFIDEIDEPIVEKKVVKPKK